MSVKISKMLGATSVALASVALASSALASSASAAPSGASSNMATTGARKVRLKTGVLPQVSIAPGEATTLASTRELPRFKVNNLLRATLPLAKSPIAQPLLAKSAVEMVNREAGEVEVTVKVAGFSREIPASAVPASSHASPRVAPKAVVTTNALPMAPSSAAPSRIAVLPRVNAGQTKNIERRTPVNLSSRHKDRILLAQLEADLQRSERRLNRADAELLDTQKQLGKFTDTLRQAMFEAGPDAKGLHPFVRAAQGYAGTPYVWGGESRNGFDCSGFIIRVMRDLGYKALPHSAAEQFRYGKPIAQALLKPGDLVFFANTYKPGISHVGIFLGKRRFIHAAGTGLGTIVSSLDATKFQAKYAGARRLVAGG